jgi:hypothetical protein
MVCKVYEDQSDVRKIHLDDLKVYCSRAIQSEAISAAISIIYTRNIMKYIRFIGQ